jgi:hypothetical protein
VTEIEVDVSRIDLRRRTRLSDTIEELATEHGLSISMKKPMAKLSGSMHWHLKKGRERGTLEVTLLAEGRLWFSMHENRSADWVIDAAREFKRLLERP